MKRIFACLLVLTLLLSLAACGGQTEETTASETTESTTAPAETEPAAPAEVVNNGGNVVGWDGNVYYFRIAQGAYENVALLGAYLLDSSAKHDLVVRAGDGSEQTLLSTEASGSIWICSGRVVYKKTDGWYYADLQEPAEQFYTDSAIIGYIPEHDVLVLQKKDGTVYTDNTRGNGVEIVQGDYTAIAIHGDYYYHYSDDEAGNYNFYRVNMADQSVEDLGSVCVPDESGWARSMEDICVGNDGIYILIGYYGGTGFFFQEASIYYLPFDGSGMQVLVDGEVCYSMMYLGTGEDGKQYLYYYADAYVLGVGLYQGAQSENVCRYDVSTGETEMVDFPLCAQNVPYIFDGKLMILEGGLEPTVILGAEEAQQMGYAGLGFRDDGSAAYQETVDKVGDVYYITVTESVPEPSADLGWRPGYARNSTKLFRYDPATGEIQLIHSY